MTILQSKLTTKSAHINLDGVGRGNENVGQNVIVPRIKLLQKMSNEADKHHKEHIKGAEVGDFITPDRKPCRNLLPVAHFQGAWAVAQHGSGRRLRWQLRNGTRS